MQYRSRQDIAAAILHIAREGSIKTRIMYRAFLSYPQLKEYLDVLMENGLLAYDEEQGKYHATQKGMQYLSMYKALDKMVPKDNMLTKVIEA
jgi:predicted transcriptional regulator